MITESRARKFAQEWIEAWLLNVFTCVDGVTVYYRAVFGKLATEVFFLDEHGKAYKALAHYSGLAPSQRESA